MCIVLNSDYIIIHARLKNGGQLGQLEQFRGVETVISTDNSGTHPFK